MADEFRRQKDLADAIARGELRTPSHYIRPTAPIPVAYTEGGELRAGMARWGFPFRGFSWNARDDRLDSSPAWAPHVGSTRGHCLVLVSHALEPFGKHALDAIGRDACIEHVGSDAVQTVDRGGTAWHAITRRDKRTHMIPGLITEHEGQLHCTMITAAGGPVFSQLHRPKERPSEPREIVSLRTETEAMEFLQPEDNPDWRDLLRSADEDFLSWHRVNPGATKNEPTALPYEPYKPAQQGLGSF